MTLLKHATFGDIIAEFTDDSKLAGKVCTLDDVNRQDVVLIKQRTAAIAIRATAEGWSLTCDGIPMRLSAARPPSSPLTNLQCALEAIKES